MPATNAKAATQNQTLHYINVQLRSGKTRRGHELSDEKREELEERKTKLLKTQKDRIVSRVNAHTTEETIRVIEAVSEQIESATVSSRVEMRSQLTGTKSEIRSALSSSSSSTNEDKLELYVRIFQLTVPDIKFILRKHRLVGKGTKPVLVKIETENLKFEDIKNFEKSQTEQDNQQRLDRYLEQEIR